MRRFAFLYLTIALSILIACNRSDKSKEPVPATGNNQNSASKGNTIASQQSQTVIGEMEFDVDSKAAQKNKPIANFDIANYMPSSLPGAKKYPNKTGIKEGKYNQITTVTSEYLFNNRGLAVIILTDYGSSNNMPEVERNVVESAEKALAPLTKLLTVKDAKACYTWNNETRCGTLYGLLLNRFTIRIEVTSIPRNSIQINDIFSKIRISELVRKAIK